MNFQFTKTIRLVALSYGNYIVSVLLLFLQVKIMTHFLSVSDYGGWSQVNVSVSFLTIFLGLNLGHGFIRFASAYSFQEKQIVFESILIFQTVLMVLVLLIFWPFCNPMIRFLIGSDSKIVFWIIAFLALLSIGIDNIQRFLLVSGQEIKMINQNLFQSVFVTGFTIGGIYLKQDLLGALWGVTAGKLFCFVLFSWINKIDYRNLRYSHKTIKKILAYSIPLMSISIAYWVINSSNRYLINYFLGLEAVGIFSVANRLPMMLVIIFTLLSAIFLSNVSRLFDASNFDRVSYWFSIIFKLFFFLGIAGGAFLIAANRPITLILSNDNYLFKGISLVYLSIVIGSISFGGFQILSRLYDLEKQVFRSSSNWLIAMILNVLLNIFLIPLLGILGAAIATGASFSISFLIAFFNRPRRIVLNVPWYKLILLGLITFSVSYRYASLDLSSDGSIVSGLVLSSLIGVCSVLLGLGMKIVSMEELVGLIKDKSS